MQTHDNAKKQFTETSINDFWRTVESINWPEKQDALAINQDIKKSFTPRGADKMKKIAMFYILNLVSEFKTWQVNNGNHKEYNLYDLECAASNVVGGGKLNYDEFSKHPQYLETEFAQLAINNSFWVALPAEDEYYSH